MSAQIDIWFEFASTYSYLTVSRAEPLLAKAGIRAVWRPFLLGPVFAAKGMTSSPFVLDPVKGAHMWRDLERRAAARGLGFVKPARFPQNGLQAARVMTAALDQPWCVGFARAVYRAQFAEGRDIADPDTLRDALTGCGVEPDAWLARAQAQEVKDQLRATTEQAQARGIFGAPSFTVGDEMFWGDDRLEDAMDWALGRHLLQAG